MADASSTGGVELAPGVWAADTDLRFHFARAGGPGGQNVNKVNTKAELRIALTAFRGISFRALERLKAAHAGRITSAGDLLIAAESSRSQFANRQLCLAKLRELLVSALHEPKLRRKTQPTWGSQQRRLETKKLRSHTKAQRRPPTE